MNTTKNLVLAAVAVMSLAVMSLGVGTAMAQDGGQAYPEYWSARQRTAPAGATFTRDSSAVQSGSSDFDQSGSDHSATYILNHGLAGAGGVAG
jgi:hypothetical protein